MNKFNVNKAKLNLKKLRGQIDNIDIMIDKERDCLEIIQQINAAIGMFKKSKEYILENHLETCLAEKLNLKKGVEKTKFIKGLVYSFKIIS
ncbi:MAG: hypothetical protein US42_C0012G0007 [Candidatus Magasanikbacteria bacterium GW2011_GWC2_37_14]|uniref:Copper-sensing transcriptional repressor CsoR n=1 Tax=Candidatus Magasanikbacteria bacterium GW2011_GWC2_37_14 TaxID=1619046 RepID=A0A0G0JGI8_9BACT|nr:MAG: hypothetical protein US42_C0012G0007 [Candidatus Magasanikbacteria bacterium GW2011_GWC2_37_14]